MVCAGVHKVTGEVVAVKQIPRRLMSTPRLQAEVDLLRMAGQHKNVVGFRDLFSDGNFYYIVMGESGSRVDTAAVAVVPAPPYRVLSPRPEIFRSIFPSAVHGLLRFFFHTDATKKSTCFEYSLHPA